MFKNTPLEEPDSDSDIDLYCYESLSDIITDHNNCMLEYNTCISQVEILSDMSDDSEDIEEFKF